MNNAQSKLGSYLFFVCLIDMIPTTLLCVLGLAVSIRSVVMRFNFDHVISPAMSYAFIILLAAGYSLYALWWLLFRFQKIQFSEIPIHIKIGLVIGCIAGLLFFASTFYINIFSQPEGFLFFKNILFLWLVSGSPIIALSLMTFFIFKRAKLNQIKN